VNQTRYHQARIGLLVALGFECLALLVVFLVPGLAPIAWVVVAVSFFTVIGESITLVKLRKQR
jgi:hypothetical protein